MTKVRKKIGTIPINDIEQQVQQSTSAAITQMQQDVSDFIDEETAQYPEIGGTFKYIEDPEGRTEIKTDAEGKILSYRDSEGVVHENVGIESAVINTKSINLSSEGLTDLEKALRENGMSSGTGDWTDYISNDGDNPLCLAEPRYAILNILSDINLSTLLKEGYEGAVEGVNYNVPTEVQFWDMQGNYFKKWTLMSAQGNSSMAYAKRNLAFDFFDTSVYDSKGKIGKGDAFKTKFGDWIAQDSYHLKAFYTDFFRGVSIMSYKISDQVDKTRDQIENRVWKKALLGNYKNGTDLLTMPQDDNLDLQLDNGARCMPDAFPVIVYQNGNFWGIYAWCIKKHRDNYNMKKSSAKQIHLDGTIGDVFFLGYKPYQWFEVRNPKDLYANDGTKYEEGDTLADTTLVDTWIDQGTLPDGTVVDDKIKKNLQNSAKVDSYITDFGTRFKNIRDAATAYETSSKTPADLQAFKDVFEVLFDVDNLIDYELIQLAVDDTDGFAKNWQWVTYDGIKWYVCEYDKDMSFGGMFNGVCTRKVRTEGGWYGITYNSETGLPQKDGPIYFLTTYYQPELKARWQELVSKGVFTANNFMSVVNSWIDRIGKNFYEQEWAKWPESPCNRDLGVNTEYWKLIDYGPEQEETYDESKTYSVGETCVLCTNYDYGFSWTYECIKESIGNYPATRTAQENPIRHGYRDSIWRLKNFISQNLEVLNNWFETL